MRISSFSLLFSSTNKQIFARVAGDNFSEYQSVPNDVDVENGSFAPSHRFQKQIWDFKTEITFFIFRALRDKVRVLVIHGHFQQLFSDTTRVFVGSIMSI
jgi:hypothetical protein